jgi:transposase
MSALLSDELWGVVKPLLPVHPWSPKGGAPRCDDRKCLEGILYILRSGSAWNLLPKEFGVSSTTCWRRFKEWTQLGVWDQVHRKLLRGLAEVKALDIKRVVIDSASVRALFGGRTPARTPRIAGKMAVNAI